MRLELELTQVTAKVIDVNPRKEGKEKEILAADLKFEVGLTSEILAVFSPTLKSFLFDSNGQLDLAGGIDVRYAALDYPLSWNAELLGAHVSVMGADGQLIVFPETAINKFKMTPCNGGVVVLQFVVQVYPDVSQIGRMSDLIGQQTAITITLPELPEMKAAA